MEKEKTECSQWNHLRINLNKDLAYNPEWESAIKLFSDRFKVKYFDPIQQLIELDWLKGEGFTILTVQCSLIEAFATLRTGQIFTNNRVAAVKKKYLYFESKRIFTDFLESEAIFKEHFWAEDPNEKDGKARVPPFSASSFYSDVRCALMHEARTKGNWIINADPISKVDPRKAVFIEKEGDHLKIYRTILHFRLQDYLTQYCLELKEPKNNRLRLYFARKMDHLFQYPANSKRFIWWEDK
ncbi:hypothetical protein ACFFGT_02215 [Mucilaginibacter angelicae]|uniref:Uncharacterized protein n=1 Tax=Mucilaginibacter angelicae TaxID=869718 RepID=A0ABV6KZT6_9SPHI